ncbi:MAG: CapA family protein [Chloroflexi bacterium]|nr:CapA family protein [Chloroflexota bacterium]
MNSHPKIILAVFAIPVLIAACKSNPSLDLPVVPEIVTTLQSERATEAVELQQFTRIPNIPQPSSTEPDVLSLWIAPHLPASLQVQLVVPSEFNLVDQADHAALRLDVGEQNVISRWVYALVVPFPTVSDGLTSDELQRSWAGSPAGPFAAYPLLMEQNTLDMFSLRWGTPADGAVKVIPTDQLLDYAWDNRPAWAIVPFEALEPRWKALQVDGLSPIQKEFDPSIYSLSLPISLFSQDETLLAAISTLYGPGSSNPLLPAQNIDPDKFTTVMMTGVTALVRATAWEMERKGLTWPAEDIGALLRQADITHISNEVPFVADCPRPDPNQKDLIFCSDPSYMQLLEAVGADVIELTGDHFGDYGPAGMYFTLELYDSYGLLYYGGGKNLELGRQPLLLEHNGNRIAFLGCNAKGGGYAPADENQPGAVECDYEWIQAEIARLRTQGYLVIFTFQHIEYYTYEPAPDQIRDFRSVAAAGAVIVSGSQAHQAQGMEFFEGSLVMYGLGNLFFDQIGVSEDTARALIARHTFYDGRHISTELFTIIFVDYARPRFMTPQERLVLLLKVFEGSGW